MSFSYCSDTFLYGTAYYAEYMPCDRIQTDFRLMKEAGINLIRIAESTWSTWEPQDGEFDFSILHHMLSNAERFGLHVIVGTPTYAIPSWLMKKHPEIMEETIDFTSSPYGGRQIFDLTNPDYRIYCERLIRRLMEEIQNYNCIIGFQLDNETHNSGAYSRHAQAQFIESLKKKYPDIRDFNHEFGLDYWSNRIDSWDAFPDIRGTINASLKSAYSEYQREIISDFLHFQADIVNEYRKPGQFLTHNFDFAWTTHSIGPQPTVDQAAAARVLDVAGVDIYHPTEELLTGQEIDFGGSIARSIKKDNYFVLETEAQGNPGWLPYPGQLRLQAYSHIASGADLVEYWHWHSIHNSFETFWKGVLSHNLKPGRIYKEVQQFGLEAEKLSSHFLHLKKENKVAILIDRKSMDGLSAFPISGNLTYNDIFRWFHDTCYDMNIETDIVYRNDDFSKYSVLLVPALYSVSKETILALQSFANQGGHIIFSFKSLFCNENLKVYADDQPYGMTELAGMTYDTFTKPQNVTLRWNGISSSSGAPADIPVLEWMELLEVRDAEILASYIHPYWEDYAAVTRKETRGGGSISYIGCYFERKILKEVFAVLLQRAGLELPTFSFPLIHKEGLNTAGKKVHFFFNYSGEEQTFLYASPNGVSLTEANRIAEQGATERIAPWDLLIVEEI